MFFFPNFNSALQYEPHCRKDYKTAEYEWSLILDYYIRNELLLKRIFPGSIKTIVIKYTDIMTLHLPSFERKLKRLQFPLWNKFDIENLDHVKTLIVYLEKFKIRQLTVTDRANLSSIKDPNWMKYFSDYLDTMEDECPYKLKDKMELNDWIEITEWLLTKAIQLEYGDGKDKYNRMKPIQRIERRDYEYKLTGCETKECEDAMNELCKYLNIPANDNKVITAHTLYQVIRFKKFNLYRDGNNDEDICKLINNVDDIMKYYGDYLGFTNGNEYIDAAAIILKVLYEFDYYSSREFAYCNEQIILTKRERDLHKLFKEYVNCYGTIKVNKCIEQYNWYWAHFLESKKNTPTLSVVDISNLYNEKKLSMGTIKWLNVKEWLEEIIKNGYERSTIKRPLTTIQILPYGSVIACEKCLHPWSKKD